MANREIHELVAATSASDASLIPVVEGTGDANKITRLQYCRISAVAATSTKLYDELGAVAYEADGVNGTVIRFAGVSGYTQIAAAVRLNSPDAARTFTLSNSGLVYNSLTASRVVTTDASNFLVSSSVTTTVLNYITNVTSDVQVQIDTINTSITNINNAIALTLNDLGTASGAQVVDFAYTASKLIANGNVTLTSSNRVTADSTNIRILASGADRTVTPSASWRWTGADLSAGVVVPSGKYLTISLFTYGTAETDITASGSIQP